jgi:hypothetical protein
MLETITSTANSVSSFVNTTFTLATTVVSAVLDYNATEFLNVSGSNGDSTNWTEPLNACDGENPEFNCSVDDFLSYTLGAKQMPLETAIWVSLMNFWKNCGINSTLSGRERASKRYNRIRFQNWRWEMCKLI